MRKLFLFVMGLSAACLAAQEDTVAWQHELDDVEVVALHPVYTHQSVELNHEKLTQDNMGQNLPYLLTSTPGLVATSDDGLGIGYTYFHLRGTDPTRINISVNDIPLNDPESQTVFWVNLTDMGSSVQSMQVRRGVGSSKNGCSAFGASVQMQTLLSESSSQQDSRPVHASIQFTGGMYKTFREMVDFAAQIGQWFIGGRVSKVNSDGYVERAKSDLFSYQAEIGWRSLKQANGRQTEVNVVGFGGKEKTYMAWYGIDAETLATNRRFNPAGLITYMTDEGQEATVAYPDQTDNYTQHHAQLHLRQRFNYHWSLKAAAHYIFGRGYYQMADYGTYSPETGWAGITQDGLTNHLGGANIQVQYLHERWSVFFGGAAQYYTCRHWGTLDEMDTYLGTGQKTDANIYARFTESLLRRGAGQLNLYQDLQYRLVDYRIGGDNEYTYAPFNQHRTYHFFNPKAGLEYQYQGHELTASFAMANREPTRSNFLETDAAQTPLPVAERLYDYEIGYSYRFATEKSGIRGQVGLNLYFMDYDNQLAARGDITKLSYASLTNVPTSYRTGVELQYGLDWTRWLRWEGNLVWSRNQWKQSDGAWSTISFSPDWTAYNALIFTVAGFTGKIQNQVVSSQYLTNAENPNARLKAYTVTNVNLSYVLPFTSPKVPRIELRCLINNLFDTDYCSNGGATEAYTWYFPQAGINVHAGFSVQW